MGLQWKLAGKKGSNLSPFTIPVQTLFLKLLFVELGQAILLLMQRTWWRLLPFHGGNQTGLASESFLSTGDGATSFTVLDCSSITLLLPPWMWEAGPEMTASVGLALDICCNRGNLYVLELKLICFALSTANGNFGIHLFLACRQKVRLPFSPAAACI